MESGHQFALIGALILTAAHLPFVFEVIYELKLQAQLYNLLPSLNRRYFTISKYVFLANLSEPTEIRELKKKLRESVYRKIAFALFGLAVFAILISKGWKPFVLA